MGLILQILFPGLYAALMRLSETVGLTQNQTHPTMSRLTTSEAIAAAKQAALIINEQRTTIKALSASLAPLTGENEALKAQLAAADEQDAAVDAALSDLAAAFSPAPETTPETPDEIPGLEPETPEVPEAPAAETPAP
jgi:chromosome segregation ATPase